MWTAFRVFLPAGFAIRLVIPLSCLLSAASAVSAAETLELSAHSFSLGESSAVGDGDERIEVRIASARSSRPFNQSAIKLSRSPALHGPDPAKPYFRVRYALPLPPDNDTNQTAELVGVDAEVWAHNHSPGFEILPNGDALAIYFSARAANGRAESANDTRFVQARLRLGAEEWDLPELFYDLEGANEQSGLLWQDGDTLRFFGGGRGGSDWLPFKLATSTDNGATWTFSLPRLDKPASDYTAQPIVNAFRGADNAIYFAMDAEDESSFLWRSTDGGLRWTDMGGRTGTRHSTIVPLDDRGNLLSMGGKNSAMEGWNVVNTSSDWGVTWSAPKKSKFPALGTNQRPSLCRLANGHLCFASDSYNRRNGESPEGWAYGQGAVVGISKDSGETWHIKRLPVELPHERDQKNGTLGYVTVRQAPNGVIHLLATMTHPCLHYEFNEAWVFSDAGDVSAPDTGGETKQFEEKYASGNPRVRWSARITAPGRYLLHGREASYYENGRKEHEVEYNLGRKTGTETFWSDQGVKLWSWRHQPRKNTSTLTRYWDNGRKRVESHWSTRPAARDLDRQFMGLEADGVARHWDRNGELTGTYTFVRGELVRSVEKGGEHGAD